MDTINELREEINDILECDFRVEEKGILHIVIHTSSQIQTEKIEKFNTFIRNYMPFSYLVELKQP